MKRPRQHWKYLSKTNQIIILLIALLSVSFWLCLRFPLFNAPYSTVLTDRKGELLAAHIAGDEQWRFPEADSLPEKYRQAVIHFEDHRFYQHPGIDPIAVGRALINNIKAGKVVSGASTITMQTIRLARKEKKRTYGEKFIEAILALRLELAYSKDKILKLYASHAPFGGNVVGIRAASWRYFERNPHHLSWAEAAMLAVLPNSPGLIHPGRSRKALRAKRNKLLSTLLKEQIIDSLTHELAISEEIPRKAASFPQHTYHLMMHYAQRNIPENQQAVHKTSINKPTQTRVNAIVKRHVKKLQSNGIYNMAAMVMDTETGEVLAYTGNTPVKNPYSRGYSVDIIRAERSTGSVLKPFLYAGMLSEGSLLPHTLIPDIPVNFGSFSPQNYNLGHSGAIPAHRALARSLNVPAVHMLRKFGIPKLYRLLEKTGMTTLSRPPSHYGLSLILGGCEGTLWDICGMYASLGRTLIHFPRYSGKYDKADYHPPRLTVAPNKQTHQMPDAYQANGLYSAAGIWFTFKAMLDVERPETQSNWEAFNSSHPIAWKTGTSFGFRDAWAVGVTPRYVVGIWAGNASGEGRAGLIGVKAAAPALFDVFDMLRQQDTWFPEPADAMTRAKVCAQSGHLAAPDCPSPNLEWIPGNGLYTENCPYHKTIHLNASEKFRVNSNCASPASMKHKSWFILPPAQEWYYRKNHPEYKKLPPLHPACIAKTSSHTIPMMEIIYPFELSNIFVPVELDGKQGKTVFEAAHRNPDATLFWHIDGRFTARTTYKHKISISPDSGTHTLKIVDGNGHELVRKFHILSDKQRSIPE